jgi:hypothetical protein
VDKGFCLSYWRLSYRRKLIRTAWMTLMALVVSMMLLVGEYDIFGVSPWLWAVAIWTGSVAQLLCNYRQWCRSQRRGPESPGADDP